MGRKASRELAMKLLYQLDLQKESREDQIKETLEENDLTDKDKEYVLHILQGVQEEQGLLDTLIESYSHGWKLSRLSKVDLAILRLAIYELHFRNDIPINVAINEAIELAKKFSGPESGSFINGVLGKISEHIQKHRDEKAAKKVEIKE